jgi:4-carboxymuconolactone decarboxylase
MKLIERDVKKGLQLLVLVALAAINSMAMAADRVEPGCSTPVAYNQKSIPGEGKWEERPFRLPDVDPKTYTPEQKEAAHRMHCELGVKQLAGPHRAYIRDTRIFYAVIELIKAENNPHTLPLRLIRLIAITYSQMWKAQFEWYVQASISVRDGLSPEVVEAIRTGQEPNFTRDDERLVYTAIWELERTKALSDATFNELHKAIGDDGFVEFLSTAGTFMTVGMQVRALEMKAPGPGPADPVP